MDNIGKKFLEEVKNESEIQCESLIAELEQQVDQLIEMLGKSLTERMEVLRKKYECSSSGPPRYVVISYLRTGLLDRNPLYCVAMYNEAFLLSEKECLVMWDIQELSEPLYKIMDMVAERFQKQAKAPAYHLDELMFIYGGRFCEWFMKYLPQIIGCHLKEGDWLAFYKHNSIRISAGEYRNKVRRIFEWRE